MGCSAPCLVRWASGGFGGCLCPGSELLQVCRLAGCGQWTWPSHRPLSSMSLRPRRTQSKCSGAGGLQDWDVLHPRERMVGPWPRGRAGCWAGLDQLLPELPPLFLPAPGTRVKCTTPSASSSRSRASAWRRRGWSCSPGGRGLVPWRPQVSLPVPGWVLGCCGQGTEPSRPLRRPFPAVCRPGIGMGAGWGRWLASRVPGTSGQVFVLCRQ